MLRLRSLAVTALFTAAVAVPLGSGSRAAAAPQPAPDPCVGQRDTQYASCLHDAEGSRDQCVIQWSMLLYPEKYYPVCKQLYQELAKNCASASDVCVAPPAHARSGGPTVRRTAPLQAQSGVDADIAARRFASAWIPVARSR